MCPSDRIQFAAHLTKNSEIIGIEMKHYEWWKSENLVKIVEKEIQFIREHT